jgi:hypothetical protein
LALGPLGCTGAAGPVSPTTRADQSGTAKTTARPSPSRATPPVRDGGATAAGPEGHDAQAAGQLAAEGERVLLTEGGHDSWLDARSAVQGGYTLVDLGDDFTPYIFAEQHDDQGRPLPNRYRRVFVGLANDQLDEDGAPLAAGEKNFLELYGIFPSLSVLRGRFLLDESKSCLDPEGQPALEAVETVTYVSPDEMRKDEKRVARARRELEEARVKAHKKTVADLIAADPSYESRQKLIERRAAEKLAMAEV